MTDLHTHNKNLQSVIASEGCPNLLLHPGLSVKTCFH